MAASITATFTIIDRASGRLRAIERQAQATDRALRNAGGGLDVFSNRQTQVGLTTTEKNLRSLNTTTRDTDRNFNAMGRSSRSLTKNLAVLGGAFYGLKNIIGLLKIPAIIAAVGGLIQVVGALSAGIIALTPRLADMVGVLGAAPAGLAAMGLGMLSVKLATKGLTQALAGSETALKKLTPQGREFLQTLKDFKPAMDHLRSAAQEGLFPGLDKALQTSRRGLPALRDALRGAGRRVGQGAAGIADQLTSPAALRDFTNVSHQANQILGTLFHTLGNFLRAMEHVAAAAKPLTNWLREQVDAFGDWALQAARTGRRTGELRDYFERTQKALRDFGLILQDLWGVMRDIGHAARPLGEGIWKSWVEGAERLHNITSSTTGMAAMRGWFNSMREPLHQIWMLTKEVAEALGRLSTGREGTQMIHSLRQLVPALESLIRNVTGAFGPTMVDTIVHLVNAFNTFKIALGSWGRLINVIVRGLDWLLENVPGLTSLLGGLVAAMTFAKVFAPMGRLRTMWGGITASITSATIAEERFIATGAGVGASRIAQAPFGAAGAPVAAAAGGSMLARGGAMAGGLARAAGKFILPVSALFGAADFISTEGSVADRFQGALSGATFGLIPQPLTDKERAQQNAQAAQSRINDALTRGRGKPGLAQSPAGLRSQVHALQATRRGATTTEQVPVHASRRHPEGLATRVTGEDQAVIEKSTAQIEKLRKAISGLTEEMSAARVDKFSQQFGDAFEFRTKRGKTPSEAFKAETDDILKRAARLGPEAGGKLASNYLRWAKQMAKDNSKLTGPVDDLNKQIENSFKGSGETVRVVNNKVLTNSSETWKKIKSSIGGPAWEAEREVGGAFGKLEQQAFAALRTMGYSPSEIQGLFREGAGATRAAGTAGATGTQSRTGPHTAPSGSGGVTGPGAARGGRLGGIGLMDNVEVGNGAKAAPGELIVNRHTEARVNAMLGGRTSLGKEVANEGRPHYFAKGGHTSVNAATHAAHGPMAGAGTVPGHPELHTGISQATEAVLTQFPGLAISSTTGGNHVSGSYHYLGEAADISGDVDTMHQASQWIKSSGLYRDLQEGIHNPNLAVASGAMVDPSYYAAVWAGHADHIHMAVTEAAIGAITAAAGGGVARGAAPKPVSLKGLTTALGGAPGALSQKGMDAIKAGMEKKINRAVGATGGATGAGGKVPASFQQFNHQYAPHWAPDYGGETMAFNTVAALAEAFGMPGVTMAQIAKGESGLRPGSAGVDPGGTKGYGLWAITTGVGNDDLINSLGGPQAMWNPLINVKAAKSIYDSNGLGAWYGTSFLTDSNAHFQGKTPSKSAYGGRMNWGGWFGEGGTMTAHRPTIIGVGESGTETVTVNKGSSPGGVRIGQIHVHNNRPGDVRKQILSEIEQAFRQAGTVLDHQTVEDERELA